MKLIIEIDLGDPGTTRSPGETMPDSDVAQVLRLLADRISDPDIGREAVNCTSVLNTHGNIVGDIWLSDTEQDS